MDKTEQMMRVLKERDDKRSTYIKAAVTMILIIQIITLHLIYAAIAISEKKTDYRYFNLVNSLEKIHGVYIDTYDGTIYKTREELKINQEKRGNIAKKRTFLQKYVKWMLD